MNLPLNFMKLLSVVVTLFKLIVLPLKVAVTVALARAKTLTVKLVPES